MRTINCPRASLHSPNSTPSRHNIFIPAFSTTKTVSTKSITHPAADARRWTHAAATPSGRDQATVRQDAIDSANAAFEALLARTKGTLQGRTLHAPSATLSPTSPPKHRYRPTPRHGLPCGHRPRRPLTPHAACAAPHADRRRHSLRPPRV